VPSNLTLQTRFYCYCFVVEGAVLFPNSTCQILERENVLWESCWLPASICCWFLCPTVRIAQPAAVPVWSLLQLAASMMKWMEWPGSWQWLAGPTQLPAVPQRLLHAHQHLHSKTSNGTCTFKNMTTRAQNCDM
jgi:hypothetical protein